MKNHEETLIVETEFGFDTRLELLALAVRAPWTSAFRNVEDQAPRVVLGYSSGNDRGRSGMTLPAMTPGDARRLAMALVRAADAVER